MLKKITKWETEDGKVFDTQEEVEDYMFEQEKEVMTRTTEQERFEAWYEENIGDENKPVREAAFSAWQASRRAPAVPVPQSIEQMAVDRYKVVPSHSSMFYPCAVVAGDGQQQLYIGREGECQNMARKFMGAFLDGAFVAMQNATPAYPAEGVPAQCPNINEPRGCWRVACQLGGKCREPERSATQPAAQGLAALTPAARDVLVERKRQIESEGWKTERDDVYDTGEMALAAACYAAHSASCAAIKAPHTARGVFVRTRSAQDFVGEMWPWSADWWKPSGHRRNLEKAAALILAEIERIDRAAQPWGTLAQAQQAVAEINKQAGTCKQKAHDQQGAATP